MYRVTLTTRSGKTFVYETKREPRQVATDGLLSAHESINRVARISRSTQVGKMPKRRAKGGVCADTLTPQS